jgi:hypothetical protein
MKKWFNFLAKVDTFVLSGSLFALPLALPERHQGSTKSTQWERPQRSDAVVVLVDAVFVLVDAVFVLVDAVFVLVDAVVVLA